MKEVKQSHKKNFKGKCIGPVKYTWLDRIKGIFSNPYVEETKNKRKCSAPAERRAGPSKLKRTDHPKKKRRRGTDKPTTRRDRT